MSTSIIRLRPHLDIHYLSQNVSVLATRRDGFLDAEPELGFFTHQTRLLFRWIYLIDGKQPLPVSIRFFRGKDGASGYRVIDKKGPLHVIKQASPWSLASPFRERMRDVLSRFLPGR